MTAESKVSVRDHIKDADLPKVAEAICVEYDERKKRRKDLEKQWAEVDRQIAMTPETSHKMDSAGKLDKTKAWMPEIELPLQAQTLEMLTADARRFTFPKNRNWFKCRAALTDDYIRRFESAESVFPGERENNSRSVMAQDNADRLVEGLLAFWHSQYDFRGHVNAIDAEAFKYSAGVGRLLPVKRKIIGFEAKADNREQEIPVLVPRSIKHTYLDDNQAALMHEGVTLGPNTLQERTVNLADLKAAAQDGDDSYYKDQINMLVADKHGNVLLVELEGDLVYETSSDVIIVRDVVVTAARGAKGNGTQITHGIVREKKGPGYCTYIVSKYHCENIDDAYASSPLIKGMPVAKIAAQAMNRIMESAMLKNGPPVGYSKDDPAFAGSGGPNVYPFALWESIDGVKPFPEVGGDPQAMFEVFAGMVQLYSDVTGVNPPRLGAQTKSHTTAFAKDVELQQGAVRTIDYVNSRLEGALTRFLELEYKVGLEMMGRREIIFIEAWNEFVQVTKKHMPDIVKFIAIGAGAPAEDEAQNNRRLQSAQFALQLDAAAQELGNDPTLDKQALMKHVLSAGGWQDVEALVGEATPGGETQTEVGAIAEFPSAGQD